MVTIYTDGGSRGNPGKGASAFVVENDKNEVIYSKGKFLNICTNNQAEYNGLILGLSYLSKEGIKDVTVRMDSELVIKQVRGEYKVKDENIKGYVARIKELIPMFNVITFNHIPRAMNSKADKIVNEILDQN
ncbi:MAG: ribonuclease HI family protein [bacterium]